MEHTPIPWFIKWETNIFSGRRLVANTGGYQNNIIDEAPQNIANAEFIVRACNSHADLLEALEKLCLAHELHDIVDEQQFITAYNYAQQAIAKAKE